MSKMLWVALPLLAAAAWLAWLASRRRLPSRHALNVGSSLLLLAYVATTAGLGIFWVANQQLPVFDWHYLFGYATVLLLALHLVFNWPIVWRWLTRWRTAATPRAATPIVGTRRGAIGLLGVLMAGGAAYFLGLRHGRSDLQVQWPAPDAAALPADAAGRSTAFTLVERYHAFSSQSRTAAVLRAPGVDWGQPPVPFKRYPKALRIELPAPGTAPGKAFDGVALAAVLWHTAGVSETRGPLKLRTSPSSGALFSTELYVAVRAVAGIAPGLWHYDAFGHALEQLDERSLPDALFGAPGEPALADAAALVVATAVFRRSGHKYRDRTYRYVLADLGHALENLYVAAQAAAAQTHFVKRFDEARCAATLQLDEAEEGVLALLALRPAPLGPPAASGLAGIAGTSTVPAAGWLIPPPPRELDSRLGVTGAMHAATSLRAAQPQDTPAAPPPPPTAAAAPALLPLPQEAPTGENMLARIAARRSLRRYANTPLTLGALSGVLAAMAATPMLLQPQTLHIDLVVNAVVGLPPGAYRYEPLEHALRPLRANLVLREEARAVALSQDVIGDAAVVFVLAIDLAALRTDPVGPARAYRHALLHAGCVGERIYLEAGARGLGVCAVGAFYDDEAARLVASDPSREWIVHFAALGVPA
ncbi:MAG TPA: SagB family peptide dehydrogenase [Rubrivivax sp.]|nr:SagB family peptide dehydrogenase [Rubrivivax sp.]